MNPGILLRGAILLLSLAGLAISLHFTFTYYARIKKARWVPELLCAREGSRCVTVVQTRYAQVFGVPNSLLGVFYYLILIVWCLALTLDHNPSPGKSFKLSCWINYPIVFCPKWKRCNLDRIIHLCMNMKKP